MPLKDSNERHLEKRMSIRHSSGRFVQGMHEGLNPLTKARQ